MHIQRQRREGGALWPVATRLLEHSPTLRTTEADTPRRTDQCNLHTRVIDNRSESPIEKTAKTENRCELKPRHDTDELT